MRTTTLGSTPAVGVIGLGCMGMTCAYDMQTPRDDATSIAVIRQALDLGVTLIDTADAHGPYTNEELVGFPAALPAGTRLPSPAGSPRSTTCPKMTSGAGCRASSRTRCAPTWPSPA
jgi:Aldo/keto reductase family